MPETLDTGFLPGSWVHQRTDKLGSWSHVETYTGQCSWYSSTKTESSRRKPVTGWLYPTHYRRLHELKRFSANGRITFTEDVYGGAFSPNWTRHHLQTGNFGMMVTERPVLPERSSSLRDRAVTQALLKLKDQKVNLGVGLAEAQMTSDFLGSSFATLAKATNLAKRKKWRAMFRTLKANWRNYPQSWLGYQYAVVPLVKEIGGAVQALSEVGDERSWITTVKGVVYEKTKSGADVAQDQYNHRYEEETFNGCFVRLDYEPGNEFLQTLASLGVLNLPEILWERSPYSFVIDWAIPVGDYLSTLDAAFGYEFKSGSLTMRRMGTRRYKGYPGAKYGGSYTPGTSSWHGRWRRFALERDVLHESPLPYIPRVKNPLSLGHLANGLALLTAAFSSGVPRHIKY